MIIRNRVRRYEADERTFPDKLLVKVKGKIVELTEDGWNQQEIVHQRASGSPRAKARG